MSYLHAFCEQNHQRRDVNKTILVMNQQETSLLGSKQLETNVLELQYIYMLANHDQKVYSRFRLLKVYVCVKLESSNYRKLLFNFCKARSIEACADCFSAEFSNSAQAHMMCRVLCFALNIKGKTLATLLGC